MSSSAAPLPFSASPQSQAQDDARAKLRAKRRAAADARRLAAADEQKRAFLRMVSHELRTPLNAIIGFSEIIACELYGPLGAPQYKAYAEHVRASGHKLLRLVNQVLEMARLEGDAIDLTLQPEPIDHALDDAVAALREEIAARGAQIEVTYLDRPGSGLPLAMADARGLRTLLVNLLQNAVIHGASPVKVQVCRAVGGVQVVIEDGGPGVPAACLPRLIRPFEHAETALTRGDRGVGLGLPIVHLLCKAMGATLHLRSDTGQGFTATVTFTAA